MVNVLNYLAIAMAGVALSCLVSIMILFMGGGQAGVDLNTLMNLQLAAVPAAIASMLLAFFCLRRQNIRPISAKRLYDATPQWLVFIFLLLFSLVVFGEVAFLIVAGMTEFQPEWTAHVPLIALGFAALAMCVLYAASGLLSGREETLSGRWSG